jgi:hypothetical protein
MVSLTFISSVDFFIARDSDVASRETRMANSAPLPWRGFYHTCDEVRELIPRDRSAEAQRPGNHRVV